MVGLNPLGEKLHLNTIKHCFENFSFPTDDYVATAQDSDEEFEMLFNEISENCSVEVDNTLATSEEVTGKQFAKYNNSHRGIVTS